MTRKERNNLIVLFFLCCGLAFIFFLNRDLHIDSIKLIFYSLIIAIPLTFFIYILKKPLKKLIRNISNAKYRKMRTKRAKEKGVSKR